MTDEQLFAAVVDHAVGSREKLLHEMCTDDEQLARVRVLLSAHDQPDSLLKTDDMPSTIEGSSRVVPGVSIGPYKLREQIGEGGMGMVYIAEQDRPVRRKVALKLIKVGMDTKDVTARFEAERQALAMMDHPNIAHVLDAGSTEQGRPYFVMELVRGIPITEYCDEQKLSIRERLELFVDVCRAIQHAHQKGIIHRDIKPSNVLVTEHDGKPVPKVIDFGVAKAVGQRLTDHTVYTHHLQPVGTLLYMSPEQSRLSGLDIDTRSDVYALGLLLYELLTGALPFDKDTFNQASFDEKRRIISEEEAPKPSTRISSLGGSSTAVSQTRSTEINRLQSELRGELDWILVKALDKDRNRRYESPSEFAEDITSYLDGNIVAARPPSTFYQVSKLYTRHKGVFIAVATVLAVSLAATAFSTVQWLRAETAITRLQSVLVERAFTDALSGNFNRANLTIQQASDAGVSPELLTALESLSLYFSGKPIEAAEQLRAATAKFPDSIEVWGAYFLVSHSAGDYAYMGKCKSMVNSAPEPTTYAQKLFHAMVHVYSDPGEVLNQLTPQLELTPHSPILRAVVAVAQRDIVQRTKDEALLADLIERFREADLAAPNNFYIQTEYLLALVDGIKFARFLGRAEKSQRYQEQAIDLVNSLEQAEASRMYSRMSRATFYAAMGDEGSLEKLAEIESLPSVGLTTSQQRAAAKLFAAEKFEELLKTSETTFIQSHANARAFAEIETAVNPSSRIMTAHRVFQDVSEQRANSAIGTDVIALESFLFAGDIPTLRQQATKLQLKKADFEWHMYDRILQLYSDPNEQAIADVLAFARPFSEETSYSEYCVGMIRLAQGRRGDAKLHFENCVRQGKYDWWSHVWARAFLKRMEDPTWPHWIPHVDAEKSINKE